MNDSNSDTTTDGTKRIHFLTGVEDLGAAYVCQRCGHATAMKVEMWEHRKGLISRCFRTRLKRKWRSLHTGTEQ